MRVMMTVSMPAAAGNEGLKSGAFPQALQGLLDSVKPEAAYFGAHNGMRTMFVVFDLVSPAKIPSICEPFFNAIDAKIDITPVMDQADLMAGLGDLQAAGLAG